MPLEQKKQIRAAVCDTGRNFRGGQRQSYNLLTGLQARLVDVRAYCPADSPLMSRLREESILTHALEYDAIKVLFRAYSLAGEMRKDSVNIFQASDSHSHTIGALVKRYFPQIKLAVTVRTCFGKANPFKMMFKYSNRIVDKFMAISGAVKDNLLRMGISEDRIQIIHSCYDKSIFTRTGRSESGHLRIGTACSLESGKGVGTIIEALGQVKQKLGKFTFMIAGIGSQREDFEQQARQCGLSDNIRFCGFVKDMAGFYRNLDVYILASLLEGLGSSLLEAGACGAALISSKVGGTVDIIEDGINGRLFTAGMASELADIIYELKQKPEMRSKFQKELDKKLVLFDKEYMVEKYIKLYQELLES